MCDENCHFQMPGDDLTNVFRTRRTAFVMVTRGQLTPVERRRQLALSDRQRNAIIRRRLKRESRIVALAKTARILVGNGIRYHDARISRRARKGPKSV